MHVVPGWGNRFGRFYSARTLLERLLGPLAREFPFRIFRLLNRESISEKIYARWVLLAQRQ